MAIQLDTLKCPYCGDSSGLEKIGFGKYHCKICQSTCIGQGNDEKSLIIVPSEERWAHLHKIVKDSQSDEGLKEAYIELNKAFPFDLEAELDSIDQNTANTIKTEFQGLTGELKTFKDKGDQWDNLATVILRVLFCKSLFGDFNTVANVVANVKECKAVTPHFWFKLYQNYFDSGKDANASMSILLFVSKIKDSCRGKDGKYDEVTFFDFASSLAKSAKTAEHFEFYIAFIKDTLNDQDFLSQVYPLKKLYFSPTLRRHVKTLNKYYVTFDKQLNRRSA